MHIEPGFVSPAKVLLANGAAIAVAVSGLAHALTAIVKTPLKLLLILGRVVVGAIVFSLFMQAYHVPVGPSELHFVGAMAVYLTLGFTPTLIAFPVGLAVQGLLFEPGDLVHLGVNSLSLMLPLIAVHAGFGHKLFTKPEAAAVEVTWKRIVALDASYYAGVTAMVGFWLAIGEETTAFSSWLAFAASYLSVVALEPVATLLAVKGLRRAPHASWFARLAVVDRLRLPA